jgi:hypothetical protein
MLPEDAPDGLLGDVATQKLGDEKSDLRASVPGVLSFDLNDELDQFS